MKPDRSLFHLDPLEESVEGKIEIKPCLFTIRDAIQASLYLVGNRHGDGVVLHLLYILRAELIQVAAGILEP